VNDVDAEFFAERDQAFEEGEVDALGGGIGGEVEDEELGRGFMRGSCTRAWRGGSFVGVVEWDVLDTGASDDGPKMWMG